MMSRVRVGLALAVLPILAGAGAALAQPAPAVTTLRVALLPQWVIQQHRGGAWLASSLAEALDDGVVDRTVFAWQRGVIQRSALVWKPVRLVPEPEATALGGRGRFELAMARPPAGRGAWTEIEVRRPEPAPDDVLMLEIGGERNTVTQVLETLLLRTLRTGTRLEELPLAVPSLFPSGGVPVVTATVGLPLTAEARARFHEVDGVGILVVRSPVATIRNGDMTPNGLADTGRFAGGDWRDADRILLRVSGDRLGRALPGLVLGWKDRTLQEDPEGEFPRRSSLPRPFIR